MNKEQKQFPIIPILDIIGSVAKDSRFLDLFKGKERKLHEFQMSVMAEVNKLNLEQIAINKIEANHKNIFVSGWRPFIGWVGGFSLAYNFVLRDFLYWFINVIGLDVPELPNLDLSELISILTMMLGMYSIRTYEKLKTDKK